MYVINNPILIFTQCVVKILLVIFLSCLNYLAGGDSLSIGFWNVENLFDLENDPEKRDDEFAKGGRKNVTKEIYDLKIKHSSEVLFDLDVDILGLCEIENKKVLVDLNEAYIKRDYNIIHFESPDERGIDNALMYDNRKFTVISSRPITNVLAAGDKTRDILYIEGIFNEETVHLFVNHWPSNYGGRERSIPKRASTAKLINNEISLILKKNRNAEIVLIGDFNENPDDQNIKILSEVGLISLMLPMIDKPKIGTYVYRGEDYLYDQIIISEGLQDKNGLSILNGSTYILDLPKYRQQEGKYAHYPFRFWAGNRLLGGYSDHLAISCIILIDN